MVAKVIVDIKHQSINRTFDYLVQEKDYSLIKKGMRVIVPFTEHNILRMGFVYDVVDSSDLATKYIEEILDLEPIFNDELFLLLNHITQNPNTLIASAFETIIPKQLLMHYEKQVHALRPLELPKDLQVFFKNNIWKLQKKDEAFYQRLKTLENKGVVKIDTVLKSRNKVSTLQYVRLSQPDYHGTDRQNQTLDILRARGHMLKRELIEQSSVSIVNTLIKHQAIEVVYELDKIEVSNFNQDIQLPSLNNHLQLALDKILKEKQHKTYVSAYQDTKLHHFLMHLIHEHILMDKQVLILVPENFMVPQMKASLEMIFRSELIIDLKSSDTDKQMRMKHTAILDHEAKIIVGARSAVFTQFNSLGIIVVIDSNNQSYIPFEGIYYDTVEIASLRARYNQIPLYLTSSALSLNSFNQVKQNQYKEIELTQIEHKTILVVDMKEELKKGNTKLVSQSLNEAMIKAFENNEKVMLILNQKGYAPFVMCRTCSHVPLDEATQIPLRYDDKTKTLKSNLTKHEEPFSRICSKCGNPTVKAVGSGIDQLIAYVHKTFPSKRILKVDSDAITNKSFHDKINDLSEVDLIVGTQMALKSNLEKKVSLIGILMIDQWLKLPKFNAYETTFDLLSQAKYITDKQLIIQSYDPEHFVLKSIVGDSNKFYKAELSRRKIAKLPPFYKLLQLRIEGPSYLKTYQYAYTLKGSLEKLGHIVLGPTGSVLLKDNEQYRILLLMKFQGDIAETMPLLKSQEDITIFMNHSVEWY